ncbi:MAG: transporter substrate-binding domain-containing protein [Rhizobiales bacterium]|nr:transporter substrate-binding domain-containing protein [Hyphomicrobiales bacterium]
MQRALTTFAIVLLAAAWFNGPLAAQPAGERATGGEIVVATRVVSPFVNARADGQLTGLSIDLWRAIATDLGLKTRFQTYDSLPALLEAVRTGKNPVGISAISITAERAAVMAFSQPMFRSGLSIMVRADDRHVDVVGMMFSRTMLVVLGILALVILVPAHIFWWIARGRDEGLPIREPYFPGIFDATFWCAESMGGAPQGYPRRVFPRVVAMIWLYAGILFIAYFTAFATTSLTLSTLHGHINGPNDLAGKRVAVVKGSTSAEYIAGFRARIVEHADFSACAASLLDGTVDAVVYDTPVIQHYALKEGRVHIAGKPFRPENYGIAFPVGSPLRRPVDEALLKIMESGAYDTLLREWLGDTSGSAAS